MKFNIYYANTNNSNSNSNSNNSNEKIKRKIQKKHIIIKKSILKQARLFKMIGF